MAALKLDPEILKARVTMNVPLANEMLRTKAEGLSDSIVTRPVNCLTPVRKPLALKL